MSPNPNRFKIAVEDPEDQQAFGEPTSLPETDEFASLADNAEINQKVSEAVSDALLANLNNEPEEFRAALARAHELIGPDVTLDPTTASELAELQQIADSLPAAEEATNQTPTSEEAIINTTSPTDESIFNIPTPEDSADFSTLGGRGEETLSNFDVDVDKDTVSTEHFTNNLPPNPLAQSTEPDQPIAATEPDQPVETTTPELTEPEPEPSEADIINEYMRLHQGEDGKASMVALETNREDDDNFLREALYQRSRNFNQQKFKLSDIPIAGKVFGIIPVVKDFTVIGSIARRAPFGWGRLIYNGWTAKGYRAAEKLVHAQPDDPDYANRYQKACEILGVDFDKINTIQANAESEERALHLAAGGGRNRLNENEHAEKLSDAERDRSISIINTDFADTRAGKDQSELDQNFEASIADLSEEAQFFCRQARARSQKLAQETEISSAAFADTFSQTDEIVTANVKTGVNTKQRVEGLVKAIMAGGAAGAVAYTILSREAYSSGRGVAGSIVGSGLVGAAIGGASSAVSSVGRTKAELSAAEIAKVAELNNATPEDASETATDTTPEDLSETTPEGAPNPNSVPIITPLNPDGTPAEGAPNFEAQQQKINPMQFVQWVFSKYDKGKRTLTQIDKYKETIEEKRAREQYSDLNQNLQNLLHPEEGEVDVDAVRKAYAHSIAAARYGREKHIDLLVGSDEDRDVFNQTLGEAESVIFEHGTEEADRELKNPTSDINQLIKQETEPLQKNYVQAEFYRHLAVAHSAAIDAVIGAAGGFVGGVVVQKVINPVIDAAKQNIIQPLANMVSDFYEDNIQPALNNAGQAAENAMGVVIDAVTQPTAAYGKTGNSNVLPDDFVGPVRPNATIAEGVDLNEIISASKGGSIEPVDPDGDGFYDLVNDKGEVLVSNFRINSDSSIDDDVLNSLASQGIEITKDSAPMTVDNSRTDNLLEIFNRAKSGDLSDGIAPVHKTYSETRGILTDVFYNENGDEASFRVEGADASGSVLMLSPRNGSIMADSSAIIVQPDANGNFTVHSGTLAYELVHSGAYNVEVGTPQPRSGTYDVFLADHGPSEATTDTTIRVPDTEEVPLWHYTLHAKNGDTVNLDTDSHVAAVLRDNALIESGGSHGLDEPIETTDFTTETLGNGQTVKIPHISPATYSSLYDPYHSPDKQGVNNFGESDVLDILGADGEGLSDAEGNIALVEGYRNGTVTADEVVEHWFTASAKQPEVIATLRYSLGLESDADGDGIITQNDVNIKADQYIDADPDGYAAIVNDTADEIGEQLRGGSVEVSNIDGYNITSWMKQNLDGNLWQYFGSVGNRATTGAGFALYDRNHESILDYDIVSSIMNVPAGYKLDSVWIRFSCGYQLVGYISPLQEAVEEAASQTTNKRPGSAADDENPATGSASETENTGTSNTPEDPTNNPTTVVPENPTTNVPEIPEPTTNVPENPTTNVPENPTAEPEDTSAGNEEPDYGKTNKQITNGHDEVTDLPVTPDRPADVTEESPETGDPDDHVAGGSSNHAAEDFLGGGKTEGSDSSNTGNYYDSADTSGNNQDLPTEAGTPDFVEPAAPEVDNTEAASEFTREPDSYGGIGDAGDRISSETGNPE